MRLQVVLTSTGLVIHVTQVGKKCQPDDVTQVHETHSTQVDEMKLPSPPRLTQFLEIGVILNGMENLA